MFSVVHYIQRPVNLEDFQPGWWGQALIPALRERWVLCLQSFQVVLPWLQIVPHRHAQTCSAEFFLCVALLFPALCPMSPAPSQSSVCLHYSGKLLGSSGVPFSVPWPRNSQKYTNPAVIGLTSSVSHVSQITVRYLSCNAFESVVSYNLSVLWFFRVGG